MISKNMIPCPLSCCINTGERENVNPVFKQQYVTEEGQIKMKMPISPMHYITKANYYSHDDRMPLRFDPNYSYYNERMRQNSRNLDFEYKNDMNKRMITPTVSFVTQPRRNLSAHIIDPNQTNPGNINYILRNIDEKLSRIEFMCRTNEEEIRDIMQLLKPRTEVEESVNNNKSKARLVPKDKRDFQVSKNREIDTKEFENLINHENSINYNLSKYNIKYSHSNDHVDNSQDRPVTQFTQNSLLNLSPDLMSRVDEKMFDASEDLKTSNDILENYIRSMKFDDMADVENKLDVLSADYAIVSVHNNNEGVESEKAEDESLLSNIESKLKNLLSKSDPKLSAGLNLKDKTPSQEELDKITESIAVFEGFKSSKSGPSLKISSANFNNALSNSKSANGNLKNSLSSSNVPASTSKSEDLKLPSREFKQGSSDGLVKPPIKLTDVDMINILKGINIPSKIKEANLTLEELLFLQGLNKSVDDLDADHTVKDSGVISDKTESSGDEFKCDLLAPTRGDFSPILRDDSIHPLHSNSLE